jgi:L-rhamnose-H+ transport protein
MRTGIIICLVSGLFSSSINIGFSLARPLVERTIASGAPALWAGNVIWVILFTSGGALNILYCARLMAKNGTASSYAAPGSARNLLLLLCMSAMWIVSFILYGVGATMMGAWGTIIGWSVYMALSIAVANCWGIAQGEWRGASRSTKLIMARGAVILLFAILVFAYGGTI